MTPLPCKPHPTHRGAAGEESRTDGLKSRIQRTQQQQPLLKINADILHHTKRWQQSLLFKRCQRPVRNIAVVPAAPEPSPRPSRTRQIPVLSFRRRESRARLHHQRCKACQRQSPESAPLNLILLRPHPSPVTTSRAEKSKRIPVNLCAVPHIPRFLAGNAKIMNRLILDPFRT